MSIKNEYLNSLMDRVVARNPAEPEFHQAVREVLASLVPVVEARPEFIKEGVMDCLVEPERIIKFRVPWEDEQGNVHVNRGFRVQFNSAIGPYKGGLRFHPSVYEGIIKFLGFEQIFKNSLTGYGLCYFTDCMLKGAGKSFEGAVAAISGSGNVAIYACEKAVQLGAKVVTMSDSGGYIYDKNGIDLPLIKRLKEVERKRISAYVDVHPEAEYHPGCAGVWQVPCGIALPCATQNELDLNSAKALIANGCFAVAEGANMPCTPDAVDAFQAAGVLFAPAKAANAGGVATSALEMSQNSMRFYWTFEEVDDHLRRIMTDLYRNASSAAEQYGSPGNLAAGANIAGFLKVGESMLAYGIV